MDSLSRSRARVASQFPFLKQHVDRVQGMLTCFDRVIFKGYLPINHSSGLASFVDGWLRMRRKDFLSFARQQAEILVDHAKSFCQRQEAPYRYLQGRVRKEALVDKILRQRGITEGLVCVLCVMECCPSFRFASGKGRPEFAPALRQQRVLYYYFLDPKFGLIYVRLQTWFPLTVQVYVNGHSWLARRLHEKNIGFVQHDNAFTNIDDFVAAQKLADQFAGLGWPKILTRFARMVNPLMNQKWFEGLSYYWVTDQAEIATDVVFSSRAKLAEIYPSLLQAACRFSPEDILTFLGRRLHPRFDGEVITDYKTNRLPGARIKHRMKQNWLKLYDKFGQILRVETVINCPREFRVRRKCWRDGRWTKAYVAMAKGVCNLRDYYRVGKASNCRYLDALAAIHTPQVTGKQMQPLTARKTVNGRSYAGYSPMDREDIRFLKTLLNGDHLLRGFRNCDVRRRFYSPTTDTATQRRQAASIGRKLKRLHVRKLLARIPRTRRWRVTRRGQELLQAAILLYESGVPTKLATAA